MHTGEVIGAEALIRWKNPERGLVPPTIFLPVIQNHQLAIDIGKWVIDTALTQIELWRSAGLSLPVSVNVGARQLLTPILLAACAIFWLRTHRSKPVSWKRVP